MSAAIHQLGLVVLIALATEASALCAVQITEMPDKGYRVTTDNYTAACDQTGALTSIMVGGNEFIAAPVRLERTTSPSPAEASTSISFPAVSASEFGVIPRAQLLVGPVVREGNRLKTQGKGWWLVYTFQPDSIDLEYGGRLESGVGFANYPNAWLNILLNSKLDRLADPLVQGDLGWPPTSVPEPGNYILTAANGAALVFENAHIAQHDAFDASWFPDPPHAIDVISFCELSVSNRGGISQDSPKRRILVFPHPDLFRSLEMKITSPNPDHIFSKTDEVVFPIQVTAHYGQTFKGMLKFEGNNYVWTREKVNAEVPVDLSPGHPTQTVNLAIHPPNPGHFIGKMTLTDGKTSYYVKQIGFLYKPEQIAAVVPPKDFDAFWDETMKELDKIPLDLTMTEQPARAGGHGKVYLVKYRSWGGRWAWAWLHEPTGTGKVDATVRSPAVSVLQPPPPLPGDGTDGKLEIDPAVHGGDLNQYPAKPDFDYMNDGLTSRDTAMLRYSYCCVVRCYDIIKSLPMCNGTVHAVGGSQGGGLSLVLGALRPVTDISATNVALCRIDWTILGYTKWGPRTPAGATPQDTAEIVRYYDPACFMHRIHAPLLLFVGLFDFTGPVEGIFTGINSLPPDTKCRVVVDPYGGHFNADYRNRQGGEHAVEIPRWQGSNADNKLNPSNE